MWAGLVVLSLLAIIFELNNVTHIFHGSKKITNQTKPSGISTSSSSQTTQSAYVETADFKYPLPSGWTRLAQDVLNDDGAVSGVGQISTNSALFLVKISDATPANITDLKNSILTELKNLTNFELISSGVTSVNSQSGQQFVYRFGDQTLYCKKC
ncbi:hypothetical protein HY218_01210 [Candidatus Saccharibacteria bacterium]|nr:hypothetical protein [Candidatus Saccharibacteria bacterium]